MRSLTRTGRYSGTKCRWVLADSSVSASNACAFVQSRPTHLLRIRSCGTGRRRGIHREANRIRPRGFSRQQIGVTEALIETFGDVIFRMSHNYQERQGDPYRNLDWPEIERQRENMGLADAEIAQRIGLTRDQVLHIRTTLEHRRFHTGYYVRLLDLGGGKRFRAERFTPHDERPQFSVEALELRAAMRYPSDLATKYIQNGWWSDDTLHGWLDKHAAERPDSPAIQTLEGQLSYGGLHEKVAHLARAFYEIGIGPGDVVAIQLPNIPEYLIAYLAIA